MKAKIVKNILHLEIPLDENPKLSKSQKTSMLASSAGFSKPAGLEYKGGQVSVSYNITGPRELAEGD